MGLIGRTVTRWLLLLLGGFGLLAPALAQQAGPAPDYGRDPELFPRFYRPYLPQRVPDPVLSNSPGLLVLIQDGRLRLSIAGLKAGVRENNLDVLVAGYTLKYAETDVLRARGGGSPRGGSGVRVPSGLFAGALGAGLGDAGGIGGSGSAGGISGGARQVVIRARGSLDPSLLVNFSIDRNVNPLNSTRVAGLPTVLTNTLNLQARYVQAFVTGTSLSLSLNAQRQSSTQRSLLYEPRIVSSFSLSLTHQVLNGSGRDANRRFIEVARNGRIMAHESVRQQVISSLAQAQNTYWDLVAARENLRFAELSLAVARQLLEENRERCELGRMSQMDVITAEGEVASRVRDLVIARTTVQMREVDLKQAISKEIDALLDGAEIETEDPLPAPQDSDVPAVEEALASAKQNRPEIRLGEGNLANQAVAVRYSAKLLKPTLTLFGMLNSSGLYGDRRIPDPLGENPIILPGGISQALRQLRRFSFPEYAFGFSFSIPLGNSSARADGVRARLEQREIEGGVARTRNQIELEVRSALIGLVRARAQVEAAGNTTKLRKETLEAEEARLQSGFATAYDVIRRQRDLLAAQLAEVQARVGYAKALVEMQRSMGVLDK